MKIDINKLLNDLVQIYGIVYIDSYDVTELGQGSWWLLPNGTITGSAGNFEKRIHHRRQLGSVIGTDDGEIMSNYLKKLRLSGVVTINITHDQIGITTNFNKLTGTQKQILRSIINNNVKKFSIIMAGTGGIFDKSIPYGVDEYPDKIIRDWRLGEKMVGTKTTAQRILDMFKKP